MFTLRLVGPGPIPGAFDPAHLPVKSCILSGLQRIDRLVQGRSTVLGMGSFRGMSNWLECRNPDDGFVSFLYRFSTASKIGPVLRIPRNTSVVGLATRPAGLRAVKEPETGAQIVR